MHDVNGNDAGSASLGDQAYEGLKTRILRHEFLMGAVLKEDEVASWFGGSRIPARDALRRLEQEGLVERVGRRYAVRTYSYPEILVTYRLRAALEHLSVELAVANRSAEGLDRVAHILELQRASLQTVSRGEFSDLDTAFHLSIAEMSQLEMLQRELSLILNRARLIRTNELAIDAGPEGAYRDHCRIFAALQRGDAGTAKAELDYHFATTVRLHAMSSAPDATQGSAK
ncbi:MAG: GntR family transcriptional regulator [Chelatococcus sp.]|jgi:DNA-binding GntR family transcriptional regulator|uniref:GntR family transcriptional regulator n=1 Tax=Chelatococcus sp. TaxID=1953771 RepID=UPI0025B862A5|nr:GntR family transcriptional regulator [Chelatococcus sp.]MBX3538288.1 GntR family transcriptional regulator [Chelatococcus sp.]